MKLNSEFYRLPLTFDAKKMSDEVKLFKEDDWMPHPTGFAGNGSIPLISVHGERNDSFSGEMLKTSALNKCPYLQQVIASFDEVFGRSRLMKLSGGSAVPEHSDLNYHWYNSVRIHIPIITFPEVTFYCGDKHVHMAEGETWIFDSWKMHKVLNPTKHDRIHLVIDTSGSSKFWSMVNNSDRPQDNYKSTFKPKHLVFSSTNKATIKTEKYNTPVVMSPGELDALCIDLILDASNQKKTPEQNITSYVDALNAFRYDWRAVYSQYGQTNTGVSQFKSLIQKATKNLSTIGKVPLPSNGSNAIHVFHARILQSCLNISETTQSKTSSSQPQNINTEKTTRNSPCPCGSGKKYKRCHGR